MLWSQHLNFNAIWCCQGIGTAWLLLQVGLSSLTLGRNWEQTCSFHFISLSWWQSPGLKIVHFSVNSTNSVTYGLELIECTYYCVWVMFLEGLMWSVVFCLLFFKLNSLYMLSSISVLSDYHCFQKINCNMSWDTNMTDTI